MMRWLAATMLMLAASLASAASQYTPARLAARAEIEDCIHDWARAVDRRDWALARRLFYPGTVVNHGKTVTAETLIAELEQRHRSIPMTMHKVSNIRIEFVTDTLALAESYVYSLQRVDDKYTITAARYVDRFERRSDTWKIAARSTVYDGAARFDAAGGEKAPEGWLAGSRSGDDPLARARRALGLVR